jgi:hypothetical protein
VITVSQFWGNLTRNLLGTLAAALALTASSVGGAHAATELTFTIEGDFPTVIFQLPSNPTPDSVSPGTDFYFFATPATVGGTAATLDGLTFYNQVQSYNIEYTVNGGETFLYEGSQIYTGSEASPMFSPGTFKLYGVNNPGDVETLTISVPELLTWAMMLLGFAGLGCAGFRSARARGSAAAWHWSGCAGRRPPQQRPFSNSDPPDASPCEGALMAVAMRIHFPPGML